ncbi:hypothetical protein AGLY_017204 [Aphis glycines]|uniref:Uncharacterized protein n=1 Tax=Aphis glycines TaxID=307491 RepID=A0A6G0SVI6_APHGL|nr:hypothetical protein AGLY_017204 [Aphis glycines]
MCVCRIRYTNQRFIRLGQVARARLLLCNANCDNTIGMAMAHGHLFHSRIYLRSEQFDTALLAKNAFFHILGHQLPNSIVINSNCYEACQNHENLRGKNSRATLPIARVPTFIQLKFSIFLRNINHKPPFSPITGNTDLDSNILTKRNMKKVRQSNHSKYSGKFKSVFKIEIEKSY